MERMASTRITWHDALLAPEDGRRYEAIGGELHVTPAPSVRHQRVSSNLEAALHRLLVEPGHGLLLHAPVGVEFPGTGEGVQPDIVFISRERLHIVGEDWIRGAPDLVIEILSPGTAGRDRDLKRKLYGREGVAQYWIVDPETETVEVWRFADGAEEPEVYSASLPVRLGALEFGTIALKDIFPPRG